MEKMKYIIEDSTIAQLLGVQNFTTDEAAVLELVKNAYDAKATKVMLLFEQDRLEVIDNGIGMDQEDIMQYWMHIGISSKGYEIVDSNGKKRVQAGSKGVGRFALAKLGCNICLYTKKDNCIGLIWKTDWSGSVIEEDETNNTNGTKIIIRELREKWGNKKINDLLMFLEKTYNHDAMEISVIYSEHINKIPPHFPKPMVGENCLSSIALYYDKKTRVLTTTIESDEFLDEAAQFCIEYDLKEYVQQTDMLLELKDSRELELSVEELKDKLGKVGDFSAQLYFNLVSSKLESEKFLYKHLKTNEQIDSGIILYRNAFSISSYEGKKDWLGLGKRSRKSPAAATHPTGAWRVRENQLAGKVEIDKCENKLLQDLSNRQGVEENVYFNIFVEIILTGIKEFERYRQGIIRKINVKNSDKKADKPTPVSDRVLANSKALSKLSDTEAKQLVSEIKAYKSGEKKYKNEKEEVEARYKYDVRILNVLATTGLKASSIAHEMKNDRKSIAENSDNIISALKEYDMWDELNSPERTTRAYKNVPHLINSNNKVGKKIVTFMDTMLSEIEKKQFENQVQDISIILNNLKEVWERDYVWVDITLLIVGNIFYKISEDIIQVILDNLILNSIQQNEKIQKLNINIKVSKINELLYFEYSDNGKGLDKKYISNPKKILEVHETNRRNGHGLGMWIVNNTVNLSGGEIQKITGEHGFTLEFTLGGKN